MPIKDTYFTINEPAEGLFKDKGSKFHAYLFPIQDEDDFKSCLEQVKKQHPKARHHCFAYRIGTDDTNYRAYDDGEPSGSAGKPILNVLHSKNLTYAFIVIARYFGGTLLGVPGLINAYKMASLEAIAQTKLEEKTINQTLHLAFNVAHMNTLMRIVKQYDLSILSQGYTDKYLLDLSVRLSLLEEVKAAILEVRFIEILEEK